MSLLDINKMEFFLVFFLYIFLLCLKIYVGRGVYFLEKTSDHVWTCQTSCDIVRVGKNKKGVITNGCQNHTCSQRTG